jgi:3-dehydroquinate dehydratase/shikimate dehydrogenase
MAVKTGAAAADVSTAEAAQQAAPALICTSVTAPTMAAFLDEIKEAEANGVDIIELRLDYITDLNPERDLEVLMAACTLPYIITYRPKWEG